MLKIILTFTGPCNDYLISGSNPVPDSSITASSVYGSSDPKHNYGPERARINATETKDAHGITQIGAWTAGVLDKNQFIKVLLKPIDYLCFTSFKIRLLYLGENCSYNFGRVRVKSINISCHVSRIKILQNNVHFKQSSNKQIRSTEGCSKLKRPGTRQVQERLVST